jgi:hypothetical protein
MIRYAVLLFSLFFLTAGTVGEKKSKPVIYLIGDSTVKNGSGKGAGGLWGWGDFLYQQFDTSNLSIKNLTHTTVAGAILNASAVAEGIKTLKGCKLKRFLLQ